MMPYYSEKFLLKWNDFRPNSGSPYQDLRYNPDFSDVTLLSQEDQQIEAHLIASTANSYLKKKIFCPQTTTMKWRELLLKLTVLRTR